MRILRIHGLQRLLIIALPVLIAIPALSEQRSPGHWWQEGSTASTQLEQILNSELPAWKVTDRNKRPKQCTIELIDGLPAVATERNETVILRRTTTFGPDTEIAVRFRLSPYPKGRAALSINMPSTNIMNDAERGIWFSANHLDGSATIACSSADPSLAEERTKYRRGAVTFNGAIKRSLNWPEDLRKIVEKELSDLQEPNESWMTVRYQLRKDSIRIYVNDHIFLDHTADKFDPSGMLRIHLSGGARLASVRARRLPSIKPVFEPVSIGHHVNASTLSGVAIDRTSLPPAGLEVHIQDIPFIFPEPIDGKDHLDLGSSWFRAGNLQGHLSGRNGPFGGRWTDPMVDSLARIQFRVPKGRYNAIHLVAAYDGDKNTTPIVTAQFYKPKAGFPENFSTTVPLFSTKSTDVRALPVRLTNGKKGNLYVVTIPIDPGVLAAFDDLDYLAVELTKETKLYRAYPDPSYYSFHSAGLPSGVHVYAMTLERSTVEMTVEAKEFANTWVAPARPSYTATLKNNTDKPRRVQLVLTSKSYDGKETTEQKRSVNVPANRSIKTVFSLSLKKYGYHDVNLKMMDETQEWNETLNLAYLHKDTRERGDWDVGKGPLWGFWHWGGGHGTPSGPEQTRLMALAGAESRSGSFKQATEEEKKIAEQFGMVSMKYFTGHDHWVTGALVSDLKKMPEEEALKIFVDKLAKIETKPSKITKRRYISFFPEPHIGQHTSGNLPKHWGDPPNEFSDAEKTRMQGYLNAILKGVPAVKKRWPEAKIMMPHGDPLFAAIFHRDFPEIRDLVDGLAVDIPCFERIPEQQLHQVVIHRLWQCKEEYRKAGKADLLMPMYEGPCLPSRPGGLTTKEQADIGVRNSLMLLGYGVDQQLGGWCPFDTSSYWGEQHYGGGIFERIPLTRPKPPYAAFATMTRHLSRKNFSRWLPVGSRSTYALEFKHYKTGALVHTLWTIRGTRAVTATVPKGAKVTVYDGMDNSTVLKEKNGTVVFEIDQSPHFVDGLPPDTKLSLGTPDHSDSAPGADAVKLANIGDGSWRISAERDMIYEKNSYYQIRRFPGNMTVATKDAPSENGGKALAVHLGKQEKARYVMPYYTTLVPRKPITITGKGSHLGLWVHAASDWGRVVYTVVDAKGEKWISVGTKDQWNCDDIHCWSAFCFDGWRYLKFELPAHSPYDNFREKGTTWWGSTGGDGIVDLPLKLEKIIVERRTHVMYVNDPQPAKPDDVLLGDLYVEYGRPEDNSRKTEKLSRLRMPVPTGVPNLGNPVKDMMATGEVTPTMLTKVTLPEQVADGTRCYVHFEPIEGATKYDIWVSPYADGLGAMLLGKGWKEPGGLLRGLRPDTDFYLFVVHTDKEGKVSRPSDALKIRLKDLFAMK